MYKVRRAQQSDIPAILRLLVQVDMVHHNGRPDLFKGPATKYSEAQLLMMLNDDTLPVFVCAETSGAVVGHAFCAVTETAGDNVLTDVKTLYIDDICVDENARRRGVGTLLYNACTEYARGQGCYNVTLNVWACNPGAQAFYESLGMKSMKTTMEIVL